MNAQALQNGFSRYRPRPLEIIDTSLREGQQTSLLHDHYKYYFTTQDKRELLRALILYGVKFVELFAPNVSGREAEDIQSLLELRDELIVQKGYTFLLAHVRCHPADIEAAIAAGFDGLNIYFGTSPQSQTYNHGKTTDEIIKNARALLEDMRRNYPELILRFSGEDAFRTPLELLFQVYDPLVEYVDRLGMPDTVGVATPAVVRQRVQALLQRYPDTPLELHFHDDRNLALINTMEAVLSGAQYVNTTVLGIGERSGITSMTALLFNLFNDHQYDFLEGYNLRQSYPINVMMADKLKKLVPAKEPVSLTNRTHTAGVHQGAVLQDSSTYEAHPLDVFGVSEQDILLGPLSGWNVVHYFLKEINYFDINEDVARQVTAHFKENVRQLNGDISAAALLLQIAENEFHLTRTVVTPEQAPKIVQRMDKLDQQKSGENTNENPNQPSGRSYSTPVLPH
jgi:homocitrate synthase